MKIRDLLLEYRRDVTAQRVGARILLAAAKDSGFLPPELESIRLKLAQMRNVTDVNQLSAVIKPEFQSAWIESVLAAIEDRDPTANKAYTPWLAKMYSQGTVRYEDLNRGDLLNFYDVGKRRRMIKPEHADINRFSTYKSFENVMLTGPYNLEEIIPSQENQEEKPQAKKFYEDQEVTVVIPINQTAACKYGRGTRWCTAATQGDNYFEDYNESGPLYIIIPKNPKYDREKYQLHFATDQYMDDQDEPISYMDLVTNRFPQLLEVFRPITPDLLVFQDRNKINKILKELFLSIKSALESFPKQYQQLVSIPKIEKKIFSYDGLMEYLTKNKASIHLLPSIKNIRKLLQFYLADTGYPFVSNLLPWFDITDELDLDIDERTLITDLIISVEPDVIQRILDQVLDRILARISDDEKEKLDLAELKNKFVYKNFIKYVERLMNEIDYDQEYDPPTMEWLRNYLTHYLQRSSRLWLWTLASRLPEFDVKNNQVIFKD